MHSARVALKRILTFYATVIGSAAPELMKFAQRDVMDASSGSREPSQSPLSRPIGFDPERGTFSVTRRAWRRLKVAVVDYLAARAGLRVVPNTMNGHVLFSVRDKVSKAIADPGSYFERYRTDDGLVETLDHWQARAAIEAMMQSYAKSPSFAIAMARDSAANGDLPVPQDCQARAESIAPKPPETPHGIR